MGERAGGRSGAPASVTARALVARRIVIKAPQSPALGLGSTFGVIVVRRLVRRGATRESPRQREPPALMLI